MSTTVGTKLVYDFSEGSRDMRDILGGKGANVAEMTRLGLPVPKGFTISTEACMAFLRGGHAFRTGSRTRSASTSPASKTRPGSDSVIPTTRCSSRYAAARSSRCPA